MTPSTQENQLLHILRENAEVDGFLLNLHREGGAWEILLSAPLKGGKKRTARGTGPTFDQAWDNMDPVWEGRI